MRTFGLVVARNEAGRYLADVLDWLGSFIDVVAVFDDDSTDDTLAVAYDHAAHIATRSATTPAFLDNEALFRQAAWATLEHAGARAGDWVLSVDADEFPVADVGQDERATLHGVIAAAAYDHVDGVRFPVAEVFGVDTDGCPLIRTDALWSTITAARLTNWQPDCQFNPLRLAGGSLPARVRSVVEHHGLTFLHYGYAAPADQVERHARYTTISGHSTRHVASILTAPTLHRWPGKRPRVGLQHQG